MKLKNIVIYFSVLYGLYYIGSAFMELGGLAKNYNNMQSTIELAGEAAVQSALSSTDLEVGILWDAKTISDAIDDLAGSINTETGDTITEAAAVKMIRDKIKETDLKYDTGTSLSTNIYTLKFNSGNQYILGSKVSKNLLNNDILKGNTLESSTSFPIALFESTYLSGQFGENDCFVSGSPTTSFTEMYSNESVATKEMLLQQIAQYNIQRFYYANLMYVAYYLDESTSSYYYSESSDARRHATLYNTLFDASNNIKPLGDWYAVGSMASVMQSSPIGPTNPLTITTATGDVTIAMKNYYYPNILHIGYQAFKSANTLFYLNSDATNFSSIETLDRGHNIVAYITRGEGAWNYYSGHETDFEWSLVHHFLEDIKDMENYELAASKDGVIVSKDSASDAVIANKYTTLKGTYQRDTIEIANVIKSGVSKQVTIDYATSVSPVSNGITYFDRYNLQQLFVDNMRKLMLEESLDLEEIGFITDEHGKNLSSLADVNTMIESTVGGTLEDKAPYLYNLYKNALDLNIINNGYFGYVCGDLVGADFSGDQMTGGDIYSAYELDSVNTRYYSTYHYYGDNTVHENLPYIEYKIIDMLDTSNDDFLLQFYTKESLTELREDINTTKGTNSRFKIVAKITFYADVFTQFSNSATREAVYIANHKYTEAQGTEVDGENVTVYVDGTGTDDEGTIDEAHQPYLNTHLYTFGEKSSDISGVRISTTTGNVMYEYTTYAFV